MKSESLGISVRAEYGRLARSDTRGAFVIRLDPPAGPAVRAPVSIILALDVSVSMRGDKLDAALQSAKALARTLGPSDVFGCVAFNDRVSVLLPPTHMDAAGKALAVQRIGAASAHGNTDVAQAILKCLDMAETIPGGTRVLLLTDGCPTSGVSQPAQILALARGALGCSTLSTFGFGRDVDPGLLQSIADVGRGGYTFVDGVEAPMAAIGAEVGSVLRTVMAGASLSILLSEGVSFGEIYRKTGLSLDAGGRRAVLDLPPLVEDEPVQVALEIAWPEGIALPVLGSVAFRGRRTDNGELVTFEAFIRPDWSETRGSADPEAGKQLVLARAAGILDAASQSTSQPAPEVAHGLAVGLEMLRNQAIAAGVGTDDQVVAALEMLNSARRGLVDSVPRVVRAARQDMVAASGALRSMRGTMLMGLPSQGQPDGAFTSPSQRYGMDLIEKASKAPVAPAPKDIIVELVDDDKPPSGRLN